MAGDFSLSGCLSDGCGQIVISASPTLAGRQQGQLCFALRMVGRSPIGQTDGCLKVVLGFLDRPIVTFEAGHRP